MHTGTVRRPLLALVLVFWAIVPSARGVLTPGQVLVVYNSPVGGADTSGKTISNYYSSVHPGVLTLNLNDATLSSGDVSYADFASKIRGPIQSFLNTTPTGSQIAAITLTSGIPHRILDINNSAIGDSPGSVETPFTNGSSTYATVDSELTLGAYNLSSGVSDSGGMSSLADNLIVNPYYAQTKSFTSFTRAAGAAATVVQGGTLGNGSDPPYWVPGGTKPLGPGNMYLTTRLDGNNVADVEAMISRAQNLTYNTVTQKIIINKSPGGTLDGGSYDNLNTSLQPKWQNLLYDQSSFRIGATGSVPDTTAVHTAGPVAALVSYGGNYNGADQTGYVGTFNGQLVPGAIMNTLESYNAKAFGGDGGFGDQGQLSDWIANGGTFGVGNAWEPFAGTVSQSDLLLMNFLYNNQQQSWAEAAWSSIPFLSWQQVVVGDPLAVATVVPEPTTLAMLASGVGTLLLKRRPRGTSC